MPESPGDEQKPHENDNQGIVLVDNGASGNYFGDLLVPQLKHRPLDRVDLAFPHNMHLIPHPLQISPLQELHLPPLDFIDNTLVDNHVFSKEMLQDGRDYTAALDFNIDMPTGRGDLRSESLRG